MSIKVMSRVWDKSKQKGTNLVALLAIADHADDYGVAWPGLALIAKKARVKKRQAINLVERLEASGELIVIHNRGRHISNRYFITIGLSPDEIKTTLDTHSELQIDDDEAGEKGAKDCTLSTRKGERNCTISHRKGAKDYTNYNEEKVQYSSEKVQSSTKKVQFSAQKGAIAIAPEPSIEPSINHQEEPPSPPLASRSKQNSWGSNGNRPVKEADKRDGEVSLNNYADPEALANILAGLCKIDPKMASPKQESDIKAAVTKLYARNTTENELGGEFKRWWYSFDWRGKKGDPPTPMQVCEMWERFRGAKLNGSRLASLTPDQLAAYKAREAEGQ